MSEPFHPSELYDLSPWTPAGRLAAVAGPVAPDAAPEVSEAWMAGWTVRSRRTRPVAAEAARAAPRKLYGRRALRAWTLAAGVGAMDGPDRLVAGLRAVSAGMGGRA